MKQNLTTEQSLAIDTRDASVALSAGAGCGKTFVLTERFLSYVDPEAVVRDAPDVADIVAITFTEAAAREMRRRIRDKCVERMRTAHGEAARAWWELARRLDTARISTIHGFCRSLLAEHAVEAGLDPQFRVLDEAEASLLRLAVVDDFLRQKLAEWNRDTYRLIRNGRIEALREDLLDLLGETPSPASARWAGSTPEELCAAWQHAAATSVPIALGRSVAYSAAVTRFRTLAQRLRSAGGAIAQKCFDVECLLGELEAGSGSVQRLEQLKQLAYFNDIAKKDLWSGDLFDLKESCKDALEKLRKRIDDAIKDLTFNPEGALATAEEGLLLLKLAQEANEHYRQAKLQRAALDFDDLIHGAASLITAPEHSAIIEQVRQNTFALLVDEFQDTDRRQLDLVQALCGDEIAGGKLFFVGDRKQSIYRFRGAQPKVFHELAERLPEAGRMALTKNFRSQPAILDFVNALFVHEFAPDYEPLFPDRSQVSPTPAVEFLWTRLNSQFSTLNSQKLKVEDVRRAEAVSIARRLRELLDSGEPLVWNAAAAAAGPPQARPLKRGDIAILFRSLGDIHLYESALRAEGLDYYLVGGHAFYAQQEIHDFVHLLRAVASEADELALAGALRSPILALHDETLFWLVREGRKSNSGHGALNAGLDTVEQIAELSDEERAKAMRAAAIINQLRELKDSESITSVVRAAIERTGYDAVLLGEFLGERKLANLHKLIDNARAADAAQSDLSAFATQLSHFVAKLPKEALAATSPETADVIRLMTIHQAKGLEFPLVVVPDLNRRAVGPRESVALHAELGPVVRGRPAKPGEKPPVVGHDFYRALEQDEDRAEALRILYVACTRAADYLILSSGFDSESQAPGELLAFVARNFDLESGCLLRELPDGYSAPDVRVTVCPLDAGSRAAAATARTKLREVLEHVCGTGFQPAERLAKAWLPARGRTDRAGWRPCLPPEVLPLPCDLRPREFSFSRLSGMLHVADPESASQEIREPSAPSDAARDEALSLGQLVHAVLEVLPFDGLADVSSLVARHADVVLAAKDEPYRQAVVARAEEFVARVAASPRSRGLAGARQIAREIDFVLRWPPEHANPPAPSPINGAREEDSSSRLKSPYVIRGVVDCMYEDREGDWHIVDYKTNRLAGRALADVAIGYELQLRVYAIAMEQIMGTSPSELVLWFLDSDKDYTVSWNADLRDECVDAVNRAITRMVDGLATHD